MSKGKKLKIRLSEPIVLDGDFEGFSFVTRVNVSIGGLGDILSGNFDRMAQGLAEAIWSWDFYDEDGDPFPSIEEARQERKDQRKAGKWEEKTDPVFLIMKRLPYDLMQAVVKKIDEEIGKVNPT